jgi:hypothetical protein
LVFELGRRLRASLHKPEGNSCCEAARILLPTIRPVNANKEPQELTKSAITQTELFQWPEKGLTETGPEVDPTINVSSRNEVGNELILLVPKQFRLSNLLNRLAWFCVSQSGLRGVRRYLNPNWTQALDCHEPLPDSEVPLNVPSFDGELMASPQAVADLSLRHYVSRSTATVDENSQCRRTVRPLIEVHRCKIVQEKLPGEIAAKDYGRSRAELWQKSNGRDGNWAIQDGCELDEGDKPGDAKQWAGGLERRLEATAAAAK